MRTLKKMTTYLSLVNEVNFNHMKNLNNIYSTPLFVIPILMMKYTQK